MAFAQLPTQPSLVGQLVRVAPLGEADRDRLFAVACDPGIWEQHVAPDRWRRGPFDGFFTSGLSTGGLLGMYDVASGDLIGSTRLRPVAQEADAVEIGWTFLARAYWGGRYNGEAKRLLLTHALAYVRYVVFYVAQPNERSRRAVLKIGGREIGRDDPLAYLRTARDQYWSLVVERGKG